MSIDFPSEYQIADEMMENNPLYDHLRGVNPRPCQCGSGQPWTTCQGNDEEEFSNCYCG